MKTLFLIGSGGFIGSVLRYLISKYIIVNDNSDFPWSTLFINITGSLLLGCIWEAGEKNQFLSQDVFLMLSIGLCGGFTTFSTFSAESFQLLKNNQYLYLSLYAAFSVLLGILAIGTGRYLAKMFY